MVTKFPRFCRAVAENPSTQRLWYGLGVAHDFETHDGMTEELLYQRIFGSHFGHLAVIFLWTAGALFHVAWQGNFQEWVLNPLKISPIAHAIWDPHFGRSAIKAFSSVTGSYPVNIATSGVYHWWYTIGLRTTSDLYSSAFTLVVLSMVFLFGGWLSMKPAFRPEVSWFKNNESRLNHHLSGLFGVSSLAWSGHLIHVAIPESRGQDIGWNNFMSIAPHPAGLGPFFLGILDYKSWDVYSENPDTARHIFGTSEGAGTAILTFLGGFHPQTQAMWLTDIAHHHLAISVLFIFAGHMYRTNWGIGHSMETLLDAHFSLASNKNIVHSGLFNIITNSLHIQLSFALAALGVVTSLVAQHMYALPAYAYMATNYVTQAALYTHHQYIAGFLMVGAFAHAGIFLVRDYVPDENAANSNVLTVLLDSKEAVISTLSWVSLFLGFHTLGLYVHNDVCVAFGTPENQILIEPIFAQAIQSASGSKAYGFDFLLSSDVSVASVASSNIWLPGWLEAMGNTNSLFLKLGPGDFLVHHAIALGLHVTVLILVKGALDARGSKLMPDKKFFGYSFPCDGPGRGGTCDISAWDAFYLATFWMLNTIGWVTFYWHWKHVSLWTGSALFDTSSTYIMGWLRDYLWLNSSSLINGYTPVSMNKLAVWAWCFLFGHLIWATGFMFLISWRGYWQELVETLVWAHTRTPIANLVRWRDIPIALSIVQARLVGLTHFAVGYIFTYAPFVIASTSVI